MSTTLFMLLLVLACSSCASSGSVNSIFILAGQSNMAGPDGGSAANPNVLRFTGSGWEVASSGVGPGLAFGNAALQKDASLGVVGLVQCAMGGSRITEWGKGSQYFNSLVQNAAAAQGGGGSLKAILWYQGESDSNDPGSAAMYKDQLRAFFTDVRAALGAPTLPIIQVALASGGGYREQVRQAQFTIDVPNVKTVDAQGLGLQSDGLHLTSEAEAQLGSMLAQAFVG